MSRFLNTLVLWVTRAYDYILTLNDNIEYSFTDKELHFLVIGAIGLILILMVYPLFKLLANHKLVLAITWIYVLTVLIVVTFAIEIGQRITGRGTMEFADIVAGMGGFFAVTAVIVVLHLLLVIVRSIVRHMRGRHDARGDERA